MEIVCRRNIWKKEGTGLRVTTLHSEQELMKWQIFRVIMEESNFLHCWLKTPSLLAALELNALLPYNFVSLIMSDICGI